MSWEERRERERERESAAGVAARRGGGPGQGLAGETLGLAHKHHILFRRDNLSPVFPLIYNLSGAKLLKKILLLFYKNTKKISKKNFLEKCKKCVLFDIIHRSPLVCSLRRPEREKLPCSAGPSHASHIHTVPCRCVYACSSSSVKVSQMLD